MTKRKGGASSRVIESFETLYDGFRIVAGIVATAITTKDLECFQIIIQNDPLNQNNMYVGSASSQSLILAPGQSETLPYSGHVADIYVRFTAGANQRVNWHAMR